MAGTKETCIGGPTLRDCQTRVLNAGLQLGSEAKRGKCVQLPQYLAGSSPMYVLQKDTSKTGCFLDDKGGQYEENIRNKYNCIHGSSWLNCRRSAQVQRFEVEDQSVE